jgi:hypothetical protein
MGRYILHSQVWHGTHYSHSSTMNPPILFAAGYVVAMAPPQSYLDIDTPKFSRFVNLTDPSREWHSEFSYYGHNVYSYLLAKYGDYMDLVSMQFYESYSRAGQAVVQDGMSPSKYLADYVERLAQEESFVVDFSSDPSVKLPKTKISFPLSKLVLGFANGWAAPENDDGITDERKFYASADEIRTAWERLRDEKQLPRGLMFWTINEEGMHDIYFAQELGKIIQDDS